MEAKWTNLRAWLLLVPLLAVIVGIIGWPLASTIILSLTDARLVAIDRADFLAQASNAFMPLGDGIMEGRFDSQTHRIEVNGRIEYTGPAFRANLEPATLELLGATPTGAADGDSLSLEPAAVMATLLAGLRESMPHIPVAAAGGTFVAEPVSPTG